MSSTSNSGDPPEDVGGYASYSIGLYIGLVIVIIFLGMCSYYCNRRYMQNRQYSGARASNSSVPHRNGTMVTELDSSALAIQVVQDDAILNSYPVLLYSQAKLHSNNNNKKTDSTPSTCSICLADYKDSDWLRLLPDCGHFFHRECIDVWLRLNVSCPVCRTSPFPTPLSTAFAEVAPLATR